MLLEEWLSCTDPVALFLLCSGYSAALVQLKCLLPSPLAHKLLLMLPCYTSALGRKIGPLMHCPAPVFFNLEDATLFHGLWVGTGHRKKSTRGGTCSIRLHLPHPFLPTLLPRLCAKLNADKAYAPRVALWPSLPAHMTTVTCSQPW